MKTPPLAALAAALIGLTPSCGTEEVSAREGRSFELVDVAAEAGIDVVNVSGDPRRWYIPESNGSGAAWLDHDLDGDMDLFVGNGAGLLYVDGGKRLEVERTASSRLYRNDHGTGEGLAFSDVTEECGAGRSDWINGVAVGDVDGDGDPDLYLACFGDDVLLRNEGGRFAERTEKAGLANPLWGAAATFGDPDLDGDLDLFVSNYVLFDTEAPPMGGERMVIDGVEIAWGPEGEAGEGINPGAPNAWFVGDGTGRFREASTEAGLRLARARCSYAAVFADVDSDGAPDLLVANDAEPSNLFMGRGDGRFTEEGMERGFALDARGEPTAAMGLSVEDFDGDGDQDVLRTNFDMEADCLHVNDGRGRFADEAAAHGLALASFDRLGWGGGFFDVDCDGDLDVLVANGHVMPQAEEIGMNGWAQRSQLLEAVPDPESGLRWRDVTDRAGPGLQPLRSARGVAFGDPDEDGDVDALIVDIDRAPRLLENRTRREGAWIAVRCLGTVSNRDALGATVTVHAGGRSWTREVRLTQGLYSSHDPRLHFGLGRVDAVDRVEIRWPTGRVQVVQDPPLDAFLTVREVSE
jgi:hypothetical protein